MSTEALTTCTAIAASTNMSAAKTKSSPSHKRKSTSLPSETVEYLKAWMMSPEHIAHPYPTEQEKAQIMADTGIELKQLTNWFVNNRKRYWKPRVEARLQQKQVQAPPTMPPATTALIKPSGSLQQLAALDVVQHSNQSRFEKTDERVKFVAQDNVTAFMPSPRSSRHVVSDASSASVSSETASVFSANDEDFGSDLNDEVADGSVARTETVDVHILRPLSGPEPTIADVSILPNVPSERILCTYENCELTYRFPVDSIQDRKKVSLFLDWECRFNFIALMEVFLVSSIGTKSP
jgi:hypothetical protein